MSNFKEDLISSWDCIDQNNRKIYLNIWKIKYFIKINSYINVLLTANIKEIEKCEEEGIKKEEGKNIIHYTPHKYISLKLMPNWREYIIKVLEADIWIIARNVNTNLGIFLYKTKHLSDNILSREIEDINIRFPNSEITLKIKNENSVYLVEFLAYIDTRDVIIKSLYFFPKNFFSQLESIDALHMYINKFV